jgi:predicted dienelactone hydrolase
MLSFDLVTLLALTAGVFAILFRRNPMVGRQRYLPWAALALTGVHFFLFRRPSFFPAYGIAIALAFTIRPQTYGSVVLRRAMGAAALLALVAVGALGWAFPIIRLPAPTGPHLVGSRWLTVVDSTRVEDFATDSAAKRALLLRAWYPADTAARAVAPMLTPIQAQVVAKAMNLPAFAFRHLSLTPTHTYSDVALSTKEASWPVILFSHGFGIGYESQNTIQMEELASYGYVVVSIAHPYEAGAVAFPNGPTIRMAPAAFTDPATAQKLLPYMTALDTEVDTAALNRATRGMRELMRLDGSMDRWIKDTRFVADLLAQWDSTAPLPGFAGRLRTDRLGVIGMSFGGATAASFCTMDPRCAAGINLDGLTFGAAVDSALPRPFLFATSRGNRRMYDTEFQRAAGPAWLINVAGANHLDFTDFGYVSPLFVKLGVLGGIPAGRMRDIMNAAVLGMMDAYLTNRAPFGADALTRFPEVTLRSRPAASPPPS